MYIYIEERVSRLNDKLLNLERRHDYNILVLLKKIEELQVEVKELKSGR